MLLLPILALLGSRGMASQFLEVFAQLSPGDTHVDAKIESYVGSEYDRPGGILRGSVLLSIALVTIYAIWRRPVMRRIPEARYFFVAFFAAVSYLVLFNDLVLIGDRAFGLGGFAGCVLAAQLPLAFARGTRELYYMGFAGVMLGLMAMSSRGYTPFALTDFSSDLDRARIVGVR